MWGESPHCLVLVFRQGRNREFRNLVIQVLEALSSHQPFAGIIIRNITNPIRFNPKRSIAVSIRELKFRDFQLFSYADSGKSQVLIGDNTPEKPRIRFDRPLTSSLSLIRFSSFNNLDITWNKQVISVLMVGIEPTLCYHKQILSLSRLPVPPHEHIKSEV